MHVPYELKIIQVVDGVKYKGHISLGKATLLYEMTFSIPVPRMDAEAPEDPGGIQGLKMLYHLVLHKDENMVDLSDDEYGLFLRMLLMEVLSFYNLGQTRDANKEGGLTDLIKVFGGSMEISTIHEGVYDLPQELVDVLNQSKFGCDLAA